MGEYARIVDAIERWKNMFAPRVAHYQLSLPTLCDIIINACTNDGGITIEMNNEPNFSILTCENRTR